MLTNIPLLAQRPAPTAWFEFECQTETIATSIRILYAELIAAIARDIPNTETPDLERLAQLHEQVCGELAVREHAARGNSHDNGNQPTTPVQGQHPDDVQTIPVRPPRRVARRQRVRAVHAAGSDD